VPHADPVAAISGALAGGGGAQDRLDEILVGDGGADALTLRELRLMAQADLVLHEAGVPSEVLALVRRDAARQVGTEVAEGQSGRVVRIRMRAAADG
jgi:siroheme synthase